MNYGTAIKSATVVVPVWPVLQALIGLFTAFVCFITLSKLTAHTLMRFMPELAFDTVNYNTVFVPLLIGAAFFVVLRQRMPVFAAFFLLATLLLTALPLTAWLAV